MGDAHMAFAGVMGERRAADAAGHPFARNKIWVVIPSYKVKAKITDVLNAIPHWVTGVIVVDDKCPDGSGAFVSETITDPRVLVVHHSENRGVGGATLTGFARAAELGADIIVKVDGDNQMDLRQMPALILPIAAGLADYTKGNRFTSMSHVRGMPGMRLFGNAVLSLMSKVSSGYWNVFDPTNGYTAIDGRVARDIASRKIARRYFFESDLLYHLGCIRAVVKDVPMPAKYGDEVSNLRIWRVIVPFIFYHMRNTFKRMVGQYIVRDFSIATLNFLAGAILMGIGLYVGLSWMIDKTSADIAASPGLVMGAALPVILGFQLLLSALNFDVLNTPRDPIHPGLRAIDEYSDYTPPA